MSNTKLFNRYSSPDGTRPSKELLEVVEKTWGLRSNKAPKPLSIKIIPVMTYQPHQQTFRPSSPPPKTAI
jgi:hypothetical protein|tara:strand:- start:1092 stop:1301 length:210 start_codon:yes stop_codon:yes gene_type:complete